MQPGEFAEADKGYRREPNCIRAPDHFAPVEESKIKGAARNQYETCNGSVAVLTQTKIENGSPLFKVDWPVE
jgi:hypothetical protein